MSATALAVAEASQKAIHDELVIDMARDILDAKEFLDREQMMKALFHYSAALTAVTANLVTCVLLTEQQMEDMLGELSEFETLGKEME